MSNLFGWEQDAELDARRKRLETLGWRRENAPTQSGRPHTVWVSPNGTRHTEAEALDWLAGPEGSR